jgi:hypothetical protein
MDKGKSVVLTALTLFAIFFLRKAALLPAFNMMLPEGTFLIVCHGIALKCVEGTG